MKKLLLLGGSSVLIPVIKKCHELGIKAITCDYLPDNAAHKYSDEYYNVSVVDQESVLKLADDLKVDGINSFACDAGCITAAYVSNKLCLPSVGPYESVCLLQNKDKYRKLLAENHFNVPFYKSYTINEIEAAINEFEQLFSLPVIVKPVDSAGSKGVKRVNNINELKSAISKALEKSISKRIIIEEFIETNGNPSDCDMFVTDGKISFISFSNQFYDSKAVNPYTPAIYTWPSSISADNRILFQTDLQRLLTILQMQTGIYNIECRIGADGKAYLMEVSPRGGGNRLAEMIKLGTGNDLIENSVRASIGMPLINMKQCEFDGYWTEVILHSNKNGIFREIDYSKDAKKYLHEESVLISSGSKVNAYCGGNDSFGSLIFKFDNLEQQNDFIKHTDEYIKVRIEA